LSTIRSTKLIGRIVDREVAVGRKRSGSVFLRGRQVTHQFRRLAPFRFPDAAYGDFDGAGTLENCARPNSDRIRCQIKAVWILAC
jgi:hypothetical protein